MVYVFINFKVIKSWGANEKTLLYNILIIAFLFSKENCNCIILSCNSLGRAKTPLHNLVEDEQSNNATYLSRNGVSFKKAF